jgi:hypothetical protein
MLGRAILVILAIVLLAGCVDSERLREGFGPQDHERTERIPGR